MSIFTQVYQAPPVVELEDTPYEKPGISRVKKRRIVKDSPSMNSTAMQPPPPRPTRKTKAMQKCLEELASTNASTLGSSSSNGLASTTPRRENTRKSSRFLRVTANPTPHMAVRGITSSSSANPTVSQQWKQEQLASVAVLPPTPRSRVPCASARPAVREHFRRSRELGYAQARIGIALSPAKKAKQTPVDRSLHEPTLSTATSKPANSHNPTAKAAATGAIVEGINAHAAILSAVQRSATFTAISLPNIRPSMGNVNVVAAASPSFRLGGEHVSCLTAINGAVHIGQATNAKRALTEANGAFPMPPPTDATASSTIFDDTAALDTAPAPFSSPVSSVVAIGSSTVEGAREVDAKLLLHCAFSSEAARDIGTDGWDSPLPKGSAAVSNPMIGAGSARSKAEMSSSSRGRGGSVGAALEAIAPESSGASTREQDQCTDGTQGQTVMSSAAVERGSKKRHQAGPTSSIVDQVWSMSAVVSLLEQEL